MHKSFKVSEDSIWDRKGREFDTLLSNKRDGSFAVVKCWFLIDYATYRK